MKITLLPDLPPGEHPLSLSDHHLAVAGKTVACEGGSREAALAVPEVTFTRQKTFAEHSRDLPPEEAVLDEVAVILDEHVFNKLGITDQKHGPCAETQSDDIAVFTVALREEAQRITGEMAEMSQNRKPSWSTSFSPS
jgi:hypothetical protein